MKKAFMRIGLIIFIILLIGAGVWLAIELNNKKIEINDMRASLTLERAIKMNFKKSLSFTKKEINKTKQNLYATQEQLKKVNDELVVITADNAELLSDKKDLEAKLHSLKELKKAIREVKIDMRSEKQEQLLAKKQIQKEIDNDELLRGNRGILLKDGKSTYKPRIKIEVRPAD